MKRIQVVAIAAVAAGFIAGTIGRPVLEWVQDSGSTTKRTTSTGRSRTGKARPEPTESAAASVSSPVTAPPSADSNGGPSTTAASPATIAPPTKSAAARVRGGATAWRGDFGRSARPWAAGALPGSPAHLADEWPAEASGATAAGESADVDSGADEVGEPESADEVAEAEGAAEEPKEPEAEQNVPSGPVDTQRADLTPAASLPSWVRPTLELRGRGDTDKGFAATDERDAFYLSRLRVGADVDISKTLRGHVLMQDARVGAFDGERVPADARNQLDLYEGFVEAGTKDVGVRLGRQAMTFGSGRLVGTDEWANAPVTFDGAAGWWQNDALRIDAFTASAVGLDAIRFDRRRAGDELVGASARVKRVVGGVDVEPFFLSNRREGALGVERRNTFGARAFGNVTAQVGLDAEVAWQRGTAPDGRVDAMAASAGVSWTPTLSVPTTVGVDVKSASGDADHGDGRLQTFDPLYGAAHGDFGMADLAGWRNVRSVGVSMKTQPSTTVGFGVSVRRLFLATTADGLYDGAGHRTLDNPRATSRDIGSELDFTVSLGALRHGHMEVGLSGFFGGDFVRESAAASTIWKPYAMWKVRF